MAVVAAARRLCRHLSEASSNHDVPNAITLNSSATLLDDACSYYAAKVSVQMWKDMAAQSDRFPQVFDIGSACSGTDVWGFA
eukprot:10197142-Lingulodinium_polyedra.AAC.1